MVYHYNDWVNFIIVKAKTKDAASTVAAIKNVFTNNYPNSTFDYFFIDQMYNDQYLSESRFGKVVVTFSVLAVVIACLGLFGLSSYTIVQRTKEFITISYWESVEAMSRFAGADPRKIHHLERDPEFLIEVPKDVQILNIVDVQGNVG